LIAYEIGEVHPYSKPRIEIEPYQIFSEGEGFTSLETKEK
jgi:hypothetical protein